MIERAASADRAYRDAQLPVNDRVADLLGRMTLPEKVAQLSGRRLASLTPDGEVDVDRLAAALADGAGHISKVGGGTGLGPAESAALTNEIQHVLVTRTRLGVPAIVHEEALGGFQHRGATVFPQGLGLASSWDTALLAEVGEIIRTQMRAVGATQCLAPVLDVARDPRWGRLEETFGESPELAARMGVAFIRSLQTGDLTRGVACTAKHFLGYAASIGGRNWAPVNLGGRELREVHAEPFAAAVREASLQSVMNSYSSLDGVPVAADRDILTGLLRDELGFGGAVVSDYSAVEHLVTAHRTAPSSLDAAVAALSAGLDVELPEAACYPSLVEAVESGRLPESVVDCAVERVLALKLRLGLFEHPYADRVDAGRVFDTPAQRSVARRAATESIVLLKNDGVLPLAATVGHIAVSGPHADDRRLLQGAYHYPTILEHSFGPDPTDVAAASARSESSLAPGPYFTDHVTPLQGIRTAFPEAEVTIAPGCPDRGPPRDADIFEAVEKARAAEVAVVCVGARSGMTSDATNGEARDAADLSLPGGQPRLVREVAATGTPTIVVVVSGRIHTLGAERDACSALLWCAPPGEEGGSALAAVLAGEANPSGRLPVSFPRSVGQIPVHHDVRRRGDQSAWFDDYVDESRWPLFAFGHGLSYSTFEYSDLEVVPGTTTAATGVTVSITNTSDRDGTEVVQLYVTDETASVARPVRELVGFARVGLTARSTRTVTFTVHPSRLAFHGVDPTVLATEPGMFTFHVGSSSRPQDQLRDSVRLTGPVAATRRTGIVAVVAEITGLLPGEPGSDAQT